jgi:glycosyltransferase involved in cell wall biosynthesis
MKSEKRLKIGIPISTFSLGQGLPGIDKYTYKLALALQNQEGVEVLVFQEKHRNNGPFDRFDICCFPILKELLGLGQYTPSGRTSDRGGTNGGEEKKASTFSLFRRDILKSAYYLSKGVNVIHYPTHMESPLPLVFAKTVLTFHDLVPLVHPETSTEEIVRKFERCVRRLPYVDSLITDSEFSRSEMISRLGIDPDKVTVCYPGVDENYFITEVDEKIVHKYSRGYPYILFVGTLEPRKNVESILEALREIKVPEVKLILVGKEGWGIENIRNKVKELHLDQAVYFSGYVPEEDLPHLYRGAEVFVYPSLYEGFGIPVLEAMAAGAPVVTSNAASLPEIARGSAILIPPCDIRAISEVILGILKNREMSGELREKGVNKAREFTWERCAKGALAVYRGERRT